MAASTERWIHKPLHCLHTSACRERCISLHHALLCWHGESAMLLCYLRNQTQLALQWWKALLLCYFAMLCKHLVCNAHNDFMLVCYASPWYQAESKTEFRYITPSLLKTICGKTSFLFRLQYSAHSKARISLHHARFCCYAEVDWSLPSHVNQGVMAGC